ncbi:MAG: hypothetical protein LBJ86_02835 [Spirochaetaceae bacterium]|nr:hypothetical protein [Spirochaetaceae bacterium]
MAYAAVSDVWFAFLVFGRILLRKTGLSAPIYFVALRKFRFNPLRGLVVSQSSNFTFTILLQILYGSKSKFALQKQKNRYAVFFHAVLGIFSLLVSL